MALLKSYFKQFGPLQYIKVNGNMEEFEHNTHLLKETSDNDSTLSLPREIPGKGFRAHTLPHTLTYLNAIFLCLSIILFTVSLSLLSKTHGKNALLKATSAPSPILDLLDIPFVTRTMNGTLLESNPLSIYRQPPSPAVDAAWSRIQTRDPIVISAADVLKLGKDPSRVAKFPESLGFGPDAYVGKIDVFHQIHCLNKLRMSLQPNFDYYYGGPERGGEMRGKQGPGIDRLHALHLSHCLSVLLENLMCAGNVDVYTHFWMDAQVHAFPDFNIQHKCRNFDSILAWQESNSVSVDTFAEVRKPMGALVKVMSHEFKEVFGWYDDHDDDGLEGGEIA